MPSLHKTFILRQDAITEAVVSFIRANAAAMALAGTPLAVTVSEAKSKRSGDQNRRYWAILQEIAAGAWIEGKQFSTEAWHENFKRTLIGCEDLPGGGTVGISTRTLNVQEFSDFMERVQEYATTVLAVPFD